MFRIPTLTVNWYRQGISLGAVNLHLDPRKLFPLVDM